MANANDTGFAAGRKPLIFMGQVNYGDSSAKDLFSLPANCVIVDARLIGDYTAASNATSAYLSVGVSPRSGGLGNEYLNKWSLVGSDGSNLIPTPAFVRLGAQASNSWTVGSSNNWTVGSNSFTVSGQVGNSPGAGSGPWTVIFEVIDIP